MVLMKGFPSRVEDAREKLLGDILHQVKKIRDARVKDVCQGKHHVMIISDHAGLCARMDYSGRTIREDLFGFRGSARELAIQFLRMSYESQDSISYAMAAINSLFPTPEDVLPLKAQQLIEKYGKGKNVVFVGHFPFVEKLGPEYRNIWVLEKYLRPGDLSAEVAEDFLPRADVVALTATTLLNGTCAGLLKLIPEDTFTIMLGPSTPFTPCLFDWGIDALAGCSVRNISQVKSSIQEGGPYRGLKGIDPVTWVPEKDLITIK